MPATQVYSVDFRNGNLVPSLDINGWGPMKLGDSGPNHVVTSAGEPQGLGMTVTRDGSVSGGAAIGPYVVLGNGALSLERRLLMQLEFDRPNAVLHPGSVAPWAVALNVKFGDETFADSEPMVTVTCQFHPQRDCMRLNTPGGLQNDQAGALVTPLDYSLLTPGRFTLQHHFCGVKAATQHSVGFGSLSITPPLDRSDQRAYSSTGLSTGQSSWIGALGVALVTVNGIGQISARLRNFSVSTWP